MLGFWRSNPITSYARFSPEMIADTVSSCNAIFIKFSFTLDEPISDLMDVFGIEFVSYISNYGYDRVLRILYVIFK